MIWTCALRQKGMHFFDLSTSKKGPSMWCRSGVHFFDMSTSKSAPTLRCFANFDLEISFAPQQRALFWRGNFQEWSETINFLYFWLGHASRQNGVQFFIFQLAKWFRTLRFSEPAFSTLRSHKSLEKHCDSRLFYSSRTCIFFLLTLSLLWTSQSFFFSSLPTPAFPSANFVGSSSK